MRTALLTRDIPPVSLSICVSILRTEHFCSRGVEGFTDANWGTDVDDRHSICGYVFTLNGGAVSWSSKQSVVALLSAEAEYIGITHATKEATRIRHLLSELYSPLVLKYPITLYCDNKSIHALCYFSMFYFLFRTADLSTYVRI